MRSKGGWGQILNPVSVFGRDHLVSALGHARRAIEERRNTTDSIEMEFLLYVSGERQISKAIEVAGAPSTGSNLNAPTRSSWASSSQARR